MNDAKQAINLLRNNDVLVEARAYGFSIQHHELADCDFAHCGFDNDGSISLSVNIDEDPPVQWFFRVSFIEMAKFILKWPNSLPPRIKNQESPVLQEMI